MPRYKLTLAYDGTDFCGWQKQFPHQDAVTDAPRMDSGIGFQPMIPDPPTESHRPEADAAPTRPRIELRTIQSVLERAVRSVVHQPIIIHGASRTDSGVHARGQVAAFSTIAEDDARGRGGWPVERGTHALARAINSRLPHDVLVAGAEVVDESFNPINGALSKGYSYSIWNAQERTLWDRRTSLHIYHALDVARMHAAADVLVGEHDFAAFAAAGHGRATTVRTVHACAVHAPRESLVRIDVSGSGFLWNMVRIIAGTLVEAGRGRLSPDDIREALATGDRRKAGPTLPPHGLCLEWIRYA
ncbi:MAG: tRNA pseudouridine(38-40) synthase TruA [Phycisphaerales bacterium]|nr:tRNA pseudouridine(38-40) synthase TruA [Phycisphaerales bacterium]